MSSKWERGKHNDSSTYRRHKWLSVSTMEIKQEVPMKRCRRDHYSIEQEDCSHEFYVPEKRVRYKMIGEDMKKDLIEEY